MTTSVFAKYQTKNYAHRYRVELLIDRIAGGTPMSEKAIEGWLKTKTASRDDQLRAMIAETMLDAGVSVDEATEKAAEKIGLCGFKTDENGLYIEGRQVKAMLKEVAVIAMSAGRLPRKWGATNKGVQGYVAEHIFVVEDRIPLGVVEPTGIAQRFIHKMTAKGAVSAFQCEQYVENAKVSFTVESDHDFAEDEWAAIWLTAERNGLGASRSQGFGTFTVTGWEPVA